MTIYELMSKVVAFVTFKGLINRYQRNTSLIKLKAAKAYVLAIKKIRLIFLAVVLVLVAFVLLGGGLSLVHAAILTYPTWDPQLRCDTALVLGVTEAVVAVSILFYLFREETWVRFSGIQKLVNSVVEKEEKSSK